MIIQKENIADVFCAFHDGDIIFEKEEGTVQTWKIECEYLANMIDTSFDYFWMKIHNYQVLEFEAWINPIDLPKEIWNTKEEIFKAELEISSARVEGSSIIISCNQHDLDFNFYGGELRLNCDGIEIFDQKWNKIEEEELGKICNQYWNR